MGWPTIGHNRLKEKRRGRSHEHFADLSGHRLKEKRRGPSHDHFAEREQEHTPSISISRMLGMGSP